jgi:hypothetical protein
MIAQVGIEWNWGEAILNESWRDVVSIGSLLVTIVGFGVTIWQLMKTQSAAKAAERAAKRTLEESRFAFHKFAVALAHRYVHEAKIHVDNEAWEKAAIRLSDLTDQVNQLVSLDESWATLATELHTWSVTCNRLKGNELRRFPQKDKWLELCSRIEAKLNQLLGPFAEPKGGDK